MIGPVSPACFPCGEVPRHRKKSAKKPPKKADHKHTYERVILRYTDPSAHFYLERGFVADYTYAAGCRCTICGRLGRGFPAEEGSGAVRTNEAVFSRINIPLFGESVRKRNVLKPEYANLPLVEVEDYWKLKEVITDE